VPAFFCGAESFAGLFCQVLKITGASGAEAAQNGINKSVGGF
jgi:hypothetical protein